MRADKMDEVKLKKITESIGLMQKNLECSICLDLLQDPVSTKCDHQFCNFCVLALLQSSKKPSARCPLCKVVITKRSLTKNEQLDEIVKAVRSVITAVEEDSGYRCSPPRGPVLLSQPDPRPRRPSPQKKVKGQLSSKVKGRAGNVRRTKRKVAETVSVYRDDSDSSDSDGLELPLVGHTNISSSFPKLRTTGKKGYNDDDEMESDAEDLLAALNTAPLTTHNGTIHGYSSNLEQRNNEINLRQIDSENANCERNVPNNQMLDETPPPDSEIFEAPAPPKLPVKTKVFQEGALDPYEFIPSQRTPRKVKKKGGRKKNHNAKKEFPIRSKGRSTKTSTSKRDMKSASSCSESDQENATSRSRPEAKGVSIVSGNPTKQQIDKTDSNTQNRTPSSEGQKDGASKPRNENTALQENAELITDNTGEIPEGVANAFEGGHSAEHSLVKHSLPITPVVVIQRKKGLSGNPQGSQQSSEGGMINDSQPVVINRNHGRRVFATTYGKAKNGLDKSPPLDPQERIKDWLVSKNGSDSSDNEDREEQEKDDAEELLDFLNIPQNDDIETTNKLLNLEDEHTKETIDNLSTPVDQSEPIGEAKSEQTKSRKSKLTPKKKEQQESVESRGDRRRSGRHSSQEKKKIDNTVTVKNKISLTKSPTEEAKKESVHEPKKGKQHNIENHQDQQEAVSKGAAFVMNDPLTKRSAEEENVEHDPRHKTVKQRMTESHTEQTEAARKESEANTIKSDWELALELARQFGTEPEHLKAQPEETNGRSSRRRKGKLTIEKVPESKPIRRSRRQLQENQDKENEDNPEMIEIDSFETQKLDDVNVKGTNTEKRTSKKKGKSTKGRKFLENQTNIQTQDEINEVQQTSENAILEIPETPFISNQPTGNTSLERGSHPETGEIEKESREEDLKSSLQRKTVQEAIGSSSPAARRNSSSSNPSQTSLLRRSKRKSNSVFPDSSSGKVSAQPALVSGEKAEKSSQPDEVQVCGKVSRKTSRNKIDTTNENEHGYQKDFDVPVTKITEKEEQKYLGAEREADQEKERPSTESDQMVDNEEFPVASLPLYTEDVPKGDLVGLKKCRGSDTTESIDLEIDSDEYEEADDGMEPKPLPEGKSIEKDVESSSNKQQKANLDEEMSIMDCILPSVPSQECPVLGESPEVNISSNDTTPDQLTKEEAVISVSQNPAEVLTIHSGSVSTSHEQSQASVMIISQAKTSGSFPVSLDVNSQSSESLLQPAKILKKKSLKDDTQVTTPDTQDSYKRHTAHVSPEGIQNVESTTKESSASISLQEAQTSTESSNSRPTRRTSRRKRKTFTINASPSISKAVASQPRQERKIPDSLDEPNHIESKVEKETSQLHKSPKIGQREPGHVEGSNQMQECSEIVTVPESIEHFDENLKSSPPTGNTMTRKQSQSPPSSDMPKKKRRSVKNIVDSVEAFPATADASQESGSTLKSNRKSRNNSQHSSHGRSQHDDTGESVLQLSPVDQTQERLLDADLQSKCTKVLSVPERMRSSRRKNKSSPKIDVAASYSSAIPATPGASEVNENSASVIDYARLYQLHQEKGLDEGSKVSEKRIPTPRSSPRLLRRSSRQSRDKLPCKHDNPKRSVNNIEVEDDQGTQASVTLIDDIIGKSLPGKDESQESNKSSYSVEDIFNFQEESRDMFDDDEVEDMADKNVVRIEESQSVNAEIMFLSEELTQKDGHGPTDKDSIYCETPLEAKQEATRKSTRKSAGSAKTSQLLQMPDEVNGGRDPSVSQGSNQYEDTEALIPPTPPCHDLAKTRALSFAHANGFSKVIANRKKAEIEVEPDISSLLCLDEEKEDRGEEFPKEKSLVKDTPTVVSRRRNRPSPMQAKDKSIADTPVKLKRVSVGRKRKCISSNQTPEDILHDEDQVDATELSELLHEKNSNDNGPEEQVSDAHKRMTSQTIGDTPVEHSIKSSHDSDELVRTRVKQKKQVITDDNSTDDDDDDDDDDRMECLGKQKSQRNVQVDREEEDKSNDDLELCLEKQKPTARRNAQVTRNKVESDDNDEDEHIGRQKRKAQRMVQVARDEEDESDDELIPCSFLQTSDRKPKENEEEEDDDPVGTNALLHTETEGGSVSSEDSCASHHMNLTSASSILSSQSEIMNTQQQEKTREDMETLKQQMAELQAALAQERGSRSHDDTNDEDDKEDPGDAAVDDTADNAADLLEDTSPSSPRGSRKRTRTKAVETSDEDDEMEPYDEEPRSPSPPPPLSPSMVRKTSSSISDSIRSVTSMVEQFRKSSSKKDSMKKRRIDEENDVSEEDVVTTVSSRSSRGSNTPRTGSSKRKSKKRRIEMDSSDSEEDVPQERVRSHPKSRVDLRCRNSSGIEAVQHRGTPPSRTPLSFTNSQTPGSGKSSSNLPPRADRTPQDNHTPGDHQTTRTTTGPSSVPSPVDVSMKTQRTNTQTFSPAQTLTGPRSGNRSLRTRDGGQVPSPRPRSRPMSLIATGLNRLELREVEQLTSRLANCRFASAFNANTTHVIVKTDSSLVCERTLKYFQGIAARAWIVSFKWIQDSLQARKLLGEEAYEVHGDVVNGVNHQGPRRARTCEGPGFMAKFDLCCIGPFTGLNKDQLVGLCEMCGASTVQHPSLFPYTPGRKAFIVVEPNLDSDRDYDGLQRKFRVPVISREWILDSIAHYRSQPITDYLLSDYSNLAGDQPIIDIDPDDD